jgi:hypothetical protein
MQWFFSKQSWYLRMEDQTKNKGEPGFREYESTPNSQRGFPIVQLPSSSKVSKGWRLAPETCADARRVFCLV